MILVNSIILRKFFFGILVIFPLILHMVCINKNVFFLLNEAFATCRLY